MAWFRCSCGHLAEVIPRDGYEIASVYHMHTRARVAGGNGPMRMEKAPAPTPAPTPEPALAGAPSSCLVTRSRGDGTIRCWIPEPEPATRPGPRARRLACSLLNVAAAQVGRMYGSAAGAASGRSHLKIPSSCDPRPLCHWSLVGARSVGP